MYRPLFFTNLAKIHAYYAQNTSKLNKSATDSGIDLMTPMPSTLEILFYVFDMVFDFWPLLLVATLNWKGSLLKNALVMWVFWAVVRVILLFNPTPATASFLISEPLSTILFLATGMLLWVIHIIAKRRQARGIRRKAQAITTLEHMLSISPTEFEEMVVHLYNLSGHQAKRTGAVGDNGVDIVIQAKNGEKWIAQCKRWRTSVGAPVLRDFYGAMQHEKADRGIVVTTSYFSKQAQEWAKGKPITLYDGNQLLKIWAKAQAHSAKSSLS